MAKEKNRNIQIIKDRKELDKELNYNDFQYKEYFIHLCNLIPNKDQEKLEIEVISADEFDKTGCVYVFVIQGKIFKIGHTITNIKKRIQSYNCGKIEYRISGTNSTTNYFVLQSFLALNEKVQVYAFFPEQPIYELFGKSYKNSFPPSKQAEKIILEAFIKKPIGCTQT